MEQGNEDVADNLQHQTRGKDLLVLWLDCDREGEAIGFEVRAARMQNCACVCTANSRPRGNSEPQFKQHDRRFFTHDVNGGSVKALPACPLIHGLEI